MWNNIFPLLFFSVREKWIPSPSLKLISLKCNFDLSPYASKRRNDAWHLQRFLRDALHQPCEQVEQVDNLYRGHLRFLTTPSPRWFNSCGNTCSTVINRWWWWWGLIRALCTLRLGSDSLSSRRDDDDDGPLISKRLDREEIFLRPHESIYSSYEDISVTVPTP